MGRIANYIKCISMYFVVERKLPTNLNAKDRYSRFGVYNFLDKKIEDMYNTIYKGERFSPHKNEKVYTQFINIYANILDKYLSTNDPSDVKWEEVHALALADLNVKREEILSGYTSDAYRAYKGKSKIAKALIKAQDKKPKEQYEMPTNGPPIEIDEKLNVTLLLGDFKLDQHDIKCYAGIKKDEIYETPFYYKYIR